MADRIPVDALASPVSLLEARLGAVPLVDDLRDWEHHWLAHGQAVSDAVDRAGTAHLRMFDAVGRRVDEIQYPPDYWTLLRDGYRRGVIWRAAEARSPIPFCLFGFVTAFFDPGLFCPYTVSMSTVVPLQKYGSPTLQARYLAPLIRRDASAWQGATWMTEAAGGSDLGAGVETIARPVGDGRWRLEGDKFFCSNVGAEVAVVAARPEGAPAGVRGLALFLVPRDRDDGSRNYAIRRLKDKIATRSVPTGEVELRGSDAWLLGPPDLGVYLILEVLNVSRVANAMGSVALAARALSDAIAFGQERRAFGKPIIEHPLLARQVSARADALEGAFALAWRAATLLGEVWHETPRYSDRYFLFRLVAHLAKFWTAEVAVQTAKWAVEVFGGAGTLAENRVERWLREAMILAIWEGAPHRQMLDGLEAMERRGAHRLLLAELRDTASAGELADWEARLDALLAKPAAAREAELEPVFRDLAAWTGDRLAAGACVTE